MAEMTKKGNNRKKTKKKKTDCGKIGLTFGEFVFQLRVSNRFSSLTHFSHRLFQSPHAPDYAAYNAPAVNHLVAWLAKS